MAKSSSSSNKNQEKVISFITPARKLQQSLASLSDSEFNPKGMAMVDITEKGFELTVRNTNTKAAGYLYFKSSGLINFHFSKPIIAKNINVAQLCKLMVNASNNDGVADTVTIFQLDGSNKLTFMHGSNTDTEYDVELLELDEEIEKIPDITFFCEAVITSELLRQIIKKLEKLGTPKLVSVNIKERLVTVVVNKECSVYNYEGEKVFGTRGMEAGQMHNAWFILPHMQAMWKASSLVPCLLVCFLSGPADNIMLRFCLRELGDLVFICQAAMIIENSDLEIALTQEMLKNKLVI